MVEMFPCMHTGQQGLLEALIVAAQISQAQAYPQGLKMQFTSALQQTWHCEIFTSDSVLFNRTIT